MICVCELRTVVFPMYFELDFMLPVPVLTANAIQTVVGVIIAQTLRFYPEAIHDQIGRCVVLDKTGDATVNIETGLYKHGIHVHLPNIMVDSGTAYQIRVGVLNGLTFFLGSWKDVLGIDPGEQWNDIVDVAVYYTGLRMVGSPKATKCRVCPRYGQCLQCRGIKYLIDTRVYKLCMVVDANGYRHVEHESMLSHNLTALLRECTLRAPTDTTPTKGYAIYPGCPRLLSSQLSDLQTGKKRKLNLASVGPAVKCPPYRRFTTEITDTNMRDVIRQYLVKYHSNYASCYFRAMRDKNNTIRVILSGDNATYCINKSGFHGMSRVYMDIVRTGSDANVYLKCHCQSTTTIGRVGFNIQCSQLHTRTRSFMNRGDVDILFGTSLDRLFTGTTARPNTGETDAEFLAAIGLFTTEEATDVTPQGSSTDSESSELSAHHRIRNVCKDVLSMDV